MSDDLPSPAQPLKIGTRGSPLALWQAHEVRRCLGEAFGLPEAAFEIVVIKVTGDQILDKALKEIGGKGLFTREIEEALLDGGIDIAVHSMKDMPTLQPEGLVLDCYLRAGGCARCLRLARLCGRLRRLPQGAVVGSSSLRRRAQLALRRPDLKLVEFRGNVQTRMRKLEEGVAHATFLAMAGLTRLGMTEVVRAADRAGGDAACRGARRDRDRAAGRRRAGGASAGRPSTTAKPGCGWRRNAASSPRLDGSCETPIAGLAMISGGELWLRGEILRPDGSASVAGELRGPVARRGRDRAGRWRMSFLAAPGRGSSTEAPLTNPSFLRYVRRVPVREPRHGGPSS